MVVTTQPKYFSTPLASVSSDIGTKGIKTIIKERKRYERSNNQIIEGSHWVQ